jgi:hypothetical protein
MARTLSLGSCFFVAGPFVNLARFAASSSSYPLTVPIPTNLIVGFAEEPSPYFGLEELHLSNGPLRFLGVITVVWPGQRSRVNRQAIDPSHSREMA